MSRRVLMLACSATKSKQPGTLPARERYTGPLWQTLKATDPGGRLAVASVLSAHLGWKPADTAVENYERRLTSERAAELVAGGLAHGWPRSMRHGHEVPGAPNACAWLSNASGRTWDGKFTKPFTEVCIVGGADYIAVGNAFAAEAMSRGYLAADCRVTIINDQIGYMRKALRAWLEAGATLHGGSEIRNYDGYFQSREAGGAWRFYVCGFSGPPLPDGSDSQCRVLRWDGSSEAQVSMDLQGRIHLCGEAFDRARWDH